MVSIQLPVLKVPVSDPARFSAVTAVFLTPSTKIPGQYLKLDHKLSSPHLFRHIL